FIFITGGVYSSLGKGITSSSIDTTFFDKLCDGFFYHVALGFFPGFAVIGLVAYKSVEVFAAKALFFKRAAKAGGGGNSYM
ncbi:MAG: hypothetical protein IJ939_02685, partial [Clostridia bacterium]|nr:hypothetical protein [Clostridia bacterium]